MPEGKIVQLEKADELNGAVLADNPKFRPPYVPGTPAVTVQTVEVEKFVRLYVPDPMTGRGQVASWMMRESDIKGLTAEQIASKYALPQVPTMRTDVTVPAGQQLRVTVANGIQIKQGIGGNGGGGVQFEVLNWPKGPAYDSWFNNPRPLK